MDIILQWDEFSFGIYTEPFSSTKISDNQPYISFIGKGTINDDDLKISEEYIKQLTNVKIGNFKHSVHSWSKLPLSVAPIIFTSALKKFWLDRYKKPREFKLLSNTKFSLDYNLKKLLSQRKIDRSNLVQHSISLEMKFFTFLYHSKRFKDFIKCANFTQTDLIEGTAEFISVDDSIYSILDELAQVISIFSCIIGSQQTSKNFHDLYNSKSNLASSFDLILRPILDQMNWYDSFRKRRANSTHSFAGYIYLNEKQNDIFLHQNIDRYCYDIKQIEPMYFTSEIIPLYKELEANFKEFLNQICSSLCSVFHPIDIVYMKFKEIGHEYEDFIDKYVWVKNITFQKELERPEQEIYSIFANGEEVKLEY